MNMEIMETTNDSLWDIFRKADKYNDRIYLGRCSDSRPEVLKALGITAVANLTQDYFEVPPEIKLLKLDQADGDYVSDSTLRTFLDWMDVTWAEGHTILIHCHAGISRTPSFLIAWFMHCSGCNRDSDLRREWSVYEDKIGKIRPVIQPHYKLKKSIISYFEQLV